MSASKADFFEDIAVAMESWSKTVSDSLTKPEANLIWVEEEEIYRSLQNRLIQAGVSGEDLKKVIAECLRGFAVSILSSMDGGTALAEKGRLYLINEDGDKLGEGLHNEFVGHLFHTKRLK